MVKYNNFGNDYHMWRYAGSTLGSLLFADDTNLFCSGKDIKKVESMVNDELTHFTRIAHTKINLHLMSKNAILLCS